MIGHVRFPVILNTRLLIMNAFTTNVLERFSLKSGFLTETLMVIVQTHKLDLSKIIYYPQVI